MIKRDKTISLSFLLPELMYDIENNAYVQGNNLDSEGENARHQLMDIGQDGNNDRVTRTLNLAFHECVTMLYPYTKVEVEDGKAMDDTFLRDDSFDMTLRVPSDFSDSTMTLLRDLIHEYMVLRALEDWTGITYPDGMAPWSLKLEAIKEKIQSCKNHRIKRVRRTQSPF